MSLFLATEKLVSKSSFRILYQTKMSQELVRPTSPQGLFESKDIKDVLECPVCYEICIPPIYICIAGHSVCQFCKNKIQRKCPCCRKPVNDGRNYGLESIYNMILFSCKYKQSGCNECPRGDNFQTHVNSCVFRPYNCTFSKTHECSRVGGSTVQFHELVAHLTLRHGTMIVPTGGYFFHVESLQQSPPPPISLPFVLPLSIWEFDGKHFLQYLVHYNSLITLYLAMICDESDAEDNYTADMHLIKQGLDCAPNILVKIAQIEIRPIRLLMDDRKTLDNFSKNFIEFSTGTWCFYDNFFRQNVCKEDPNTLESRWISRVDIKKIDPKSI